MTKYKSNFGGYWFPRNPKGNRIVLCNKETDNYYTLGMGTYTELNSYLLQNSLSLMIWPITIRSRFSGNPESILLYKKFKVVNSVSDYLLNNLEYNDYLCLKTCLTSSQEFIDLYGDFS